MPLSSTSNGRPSKAMDRATQSVLNASKTLLANIRFMSVDHPVRTIVITSSVPNEGKTFVTSNLASAIATSGKRVLLVECDMRRHSLAAVLDVHARHGIYSVLAGQVPLRQAVVGTRTKNLHFLDAEPHIPNPSDLLGSKHFAALLQQMEQTYDYVIFDTPPVDAFVDAAVLGTMVDAVFMVVRERFAKRGDVVSAATQLRQAGCNFAGAIMNGCETRGSDYYYEGYYREGAGDAQEKGPEMTPACPSARPAPHTSRPTPQPQRAAAPARTQRSQAVQPHAAGVQPVQPVRHAHAPARSVGTAPQTHAERHES